jgi:hypothetical protein
VRRRRVFHTREAAGGARRIGSGADSLSALSAEMCGAHGGEGTPVFLEGVESEGVPRPARRILSDQLRRSKTRSPLLTSGPRTRPFRLAAAPSLLAELHLYCLFALAPLGWGGRRTGASFGWRGLKVVERLSGPCCSVEEILRQRRPTVVLKTSASPHNDGGAAVDYAELQHRVLPY